MEKFIINNEQDLEKAIKNTFPKEQYTKALEIVKRTASLVPTGKENVDDAMRLIYFADTVLNGNAIHQNCYLNFYTDLAKSSMIELFKAMEENGFESLILERAKLAEETNELQQKKNTLSKEISALNAEKEELVEEKTRMEMAIDSLAEYKDNEMQKVNYEVAEQRIQSLEELKSLNSQKESLTKYVDELKKLFDEYNEKLPSLGEEFEVEWVPIDENSEIYSLTPKTINSYINLMIAEYQEKMHVSKEAAGREIYLKCPYIYALREKISDMYSHLTVSDVLSKDEYSIKPLLSNFKVPVYRKRSSLEDMDVSNNFNAILKVLYYQKMAGEAIAKQKVAEEQLKNVLQTLKMIFPSESSINSIIEQIGLLPEKPSDARPAQKLLN